eukprot:3556586-Rhodomonas_salina.2
MPGADIRLACRGHQAAKNRDSLAKLVYNELFGWIRDCINLELARDGWNEEGGPGLTIGLLDIFGFESFSVFDAKAKQWRSANSLEQLCINFANESLQSLFNKKVASVPWLFVRVRDGVSGADAPWVGVAGARGRQAAV